MNRKFVLRHGIWICEDTRRIVTDFRSQIGATFKIGPTAYAVFSCICGNVTVGRVSHVSNGRAISCGCHKDAKASKRSTTHGDSQSREYKIWAGMRKRCLNPRTPRYPLYGGRGISICSRWNSHEAFPEDMGRSPAKASLDRINVDGNYEPGNCRWATQSEQVNNTRRNVNVTLYGKQLTVSQWARISGIERRVIGHRMERGWTPKIAIFAPVRKMAPRKTVSN